MGYIEEIIYNFKNLELSPPPLSIISGIFKLRRGRLISELLERYELD